MLVYDEPRRLDLEIDGSYSGDLDRLPDYQNVPRTSTDCSRRACACATSDYRNSLGDVDDEKGLAWELGFLGDRVTGDLFPNAYADARPRAGPAAQPLVDVAAQRRGLGTGGDRDEPFANFYFGGFGNNWVDHGDEKRYREYTASPGRDQRDRRRELRQAMVEWNLPPLRFRRVGTPGCFLTWARPALFASGLVTNWTTARLRRSVANAAAQLDFRLAALAAGPHAVGRLRRGIRERLPHAPTRACWAQDPALGPPPLLARVPTALSAHASHGCSTTTL